MVFKACSQASNFSLLASPSLPYHLPRAWFSKLAPKHPTSLCLHLHRCRTICRVHGFQSLLPSIQLLFACISIVAVLDRHFSSTRVQEACIPHHNTTKAHSV